MAPHPLQRVGVLPPVRRLRRRRRDDRFFTPSVADGQQEAAPDEAARLAAIFAVAQPTRTERLKPRRRGDMMGATPRRLAMSAVMLGQDASSKLAKVHSPVVVLDEGGQFLGHFVPGTPPDLLAMEPHLSREEHGKRFARTTGRTLGEIMADLEKRA